MKQTYVFLLFFIILQNNFAQNITVSSFKKIENSMTARIDASKKDKNGDVCAIIKIVTSESGFIFEGDGAGIFASEYNAAEYWIWVGYSAKRITIKHPKLGILRDYFYPIPIEKATDYEMVLKFEKKIIESTDSTATKWLVISTTPSNSSIYINNEFAGQGIVSKKVKPGICEYHVEAPNYYSFDSIVDIVENCKLPIVLNPAYGFLIIKSLPEDSANIQIDGKFIANITPFKTDILSSGEHTVSIRKKFYQATSQRVIVKDNQTTPVTLKMLPNYANVTINTLEDSPIWINNENIALNHWQGRLEPGKYIFEAKHISLNPEKKELEVKNGDNLNIDFIPTGSIDFKTNPASVDIKIDNDKYGSSPQIVNNLKVGNHKIIFSKDGFASLEKEYNVEVNQTTFVSEKLESGKNIKFESVPSGLDIFVDNNFVGKTPFNYGLTYGNHSLVIKYLYKIKERNLTIDNNSSNILLFDFTNKDINLTSIPNGVEVYINDIFVGKTPLTYSFPKGNNVIKYKLKSRIKEKAIIISEETTDRFFIDMRTF